MADSESLHCTYYPSVAYLGGLLAIFSIVPDSVVRQLQGRAVPAQLKLVSQLLLLLFLGSRCGSHGPWAPEDPVPAEERQEAGRGEEEQRARPEGCRQGCPGVHLRSVPDTDARPEDFQAAL